MSRIKVAIKMRPLIAREVKDKLPISWAVEGKSIARIDQESKQRGDGIFHFDHIFDMEKTNHDVYDSVARPIIEGVVRGFNGTIFAYGQTSSGKTYTMMGTPEEPGVIPLSIQYIFDLIDNISDRIFLLRVAYIEIYNEKINDLLNIEDKDLKVRDDPKTGLVYVTCKEEVVHCPNMVLKIMRRGEKNRQTGETNMNERSSRSHSIVRITIESRDITDESGAVQVSQLNLVDLAGSERAGQTGACGVRFKEGTHINQSLTTLGMVIKQLSETQDKANTFVSFRSSKLTRMLQCSLGGNANTAIICAITPAALDETHGTLEFASRAMSVKNQPKRNEVLSETALLNRYRKQLEKLEKELQHLKSTDVLQMESKLADKERENQILEERIELLKQSLLIGHGATVKEKTVQVDSKRRRTWAGSGTHLNENTSKNIIGLPTIIETERTPEKKTENFKSHSKRRQSIFQTVDLEQETFRTGLEDFEIDLIKFETDRHSFADSEDNFICDRGTIQRRIRFNDEVMIDEAKSPERITRTPSPERQCSPKSPDTPKIALRKRIRFLMENYNALCEENGNLEEFTKLERQTIVEEEVEKAMTRHNEKLVELTNRLENLSREKEALADELDQYKKQNTNDSPADNKDTKESSSIFDFDDTNASDIPADSILGNDTLIMQDLSACDRTIANTTMSIRVRSSEIEDLKTVTVNLKEMVQTLSAENSDLTNRLANEMERTKQIEGNLQETIAELLSKIHGITEEKNLLKNTVSELQDRLASPENPSNSQSQITKETLNLIENYRSTIASLTAENEELSANLINKLEESERTKDLKSPPADHNCAYRDLSINLSERNKLLETENIELSNNLMEKIEEYDRVKEENDILQSKISQSKISENCNLLGISMNNSTNPTNNEKTDEIYDLLRFSVGPEISLKIDNKLSSGDSEEEKISENIDSWKIKCEMLAEQVKSLQLLNDKLKALKLTSCKQCSHLTDLNENRKSLKIEVKELDKKLAMLQEKFDLECANSEILQTKAKEDLLDSTMNESVLESSFSVTLLEDRVEKLRNELDNLKDKYGKLSEDYDEKCNEIEKLQDPNSRETTPSPSPRIKRSDPKFDEIQVDVDNLKTDYKKLKKGLIGISVAQRKFDNEKLIMENEIECLRAKKIELEENSAIDKEKIEVLEKEVKFLNEKIEESEKMKISLEAEIESLRNSKIATEEKIENSEKIIISLEAEIESLKKSNIATEEKIEDSEKIISLEAEIESLKNSKIATEEKIENSEKIIISLEAEIESLKNSKIATEEKIEDSEKIIISLETEIESLKNSKIATDEKIENSEKIIISLETEIESLKNSKIATEKKIEDSEKIISLESEIESLKKSAIATEEKIEDSEKIISLESEIESLKNSKIATEEKIEESEKIIISLESEIESLKNSKIETDKKIEDSEKTIISLETEIETLKNSKIATDEKIENSENTKISLDSEIESLKNSTVEKSAETEDSFVQKLTNEIDSLKKQIEASRESKIRFEAEMENLKSQKKAMEEKSSNIIRKLEERNACLMIELEKSSKNKENNENISMNNRKIVEFPKNNFNDNDNTIESLKSKLKEATENRSSIFTKPETEFNIVNSELKKVTEKLEEFIAENSKLKSKLLELEKIEEELRKSKISLENEVISLKSEKEENSSYETLKEYEKKISELQIQLSQITKNLHENSKKTQELNEQLEELSKSKEELNYLKLSLEGKVENLKSERLELEEILKILKKSSEDLKTENSSLSKELQNLKEEKQKILENPDLSKSEKTIESLNERVQKLTSEIKKFTEENVELSAKITELNSTKTDENLLKELKSARNRITKEIKSMKPSCESDDFDEKSASELFESFVHVIISKEKEIMKIRNTEFEREKQKLMEAKKQSDDAEKRASCWAKELEADIERTQQDLSSEEKKNDELKIEISKLQNLLLETSHENQMLNEKMKVLELDFNTLQSDLESRPSNFENSQQSKERIIEEALAIQEMELNSKLRLAEKRYKEKIEELTNNLEIYKIKNTELSSNLEGFELNEKQLKKIVDMKTNELTKCSNNVEILKRELEDLTEKHARLTIEFSEKSEKVDQITSELKKKCDKLSEYKTKLETITPEYENLRDQAAERQVRLEKYKSEIECLKLESDKEISSLRDKLESVEIESTSYRKQLSELTNRNTLVKTELEELKIKCEELERSNAKLAKSMRNSTSKIRAEEEMEDLRDKNRTLQTNLDGASNRITELQEMKKKLMKELADLRGNYEILTNENAQIKKTLENQTPAIRNSHELEGKYEVLLREKNRFMLELEDKKSILVQSEGKIETLTRENEKLIIEKKELDEECEDMLGQLEIYRRDYAQEAEKAYALELLDAKNKEQIEKLREETESLKAQLESCESRMNEVLNSMDALKIENNEIRSKNSHLERSGSLSGENSRSASPALELEAARLGRRRRSSRTDLINQRRQLDNIEIQTSKGSYPWGEGCRCVALDEKVRELELELVKKNGEVAQLTIKIQREEFPAKRLANDLTEINKAAQRRIKNLEAEIKRLEQLQTTEMSRNCRRCRHWEENKRDQASQSLPQSNPYPLNFKRPCQSSSSATNGKCECTKEHLESENKILKKTNKTLETLCRQRQQNIIELTTEVLGLQKELKRTKTKVDE